MAEAFSASESEVEPAVSFAYIDYKMFRKKGIGIIRPELAVTAVSDMPPISREDAMQSAAELLKRLATNTSVTGFKAIVVSNSISTILTFRGTNIL